MGEKKTSSGHLSEKVEEGIERLPNMKVSRLVHLLKSGQATNPTETTQTLLALIRQDNMAPMYESLCNDKDLKWSLDTTLLHTMKEQNQKELDLCDEQLKDAKENLGDIEVLDAQFAKATLYSRIGDLEAAMLAFQQAGEKQQSINQRIQVVLHIVRLGLFFSNLTIVETNVAKAKQLIDEGGDWDRRNRLKVYEGCYLMMVRDFKKASTLFQDSIATFTADELMPYSTMIFYCIIASVFSSSRTDLKTKIVDSPEILAITQELPPHTSELVSGLYECQYATFFHAIVQLNPILLQDQYLAQHVRYLVREFRVLAYSQFLEAYKSVTITSMAGSFGVGVAFLDSELSRFISAGRLNAKIDKVDGVVESNRPDMKNMHYQDVIKKGDHLLNRIQKLARVINV